MTSRLNDSSQIRWEVSWASRQIYSISCHFENRGIPIPSAFRTRNLITNVRNGFLKSLRPTDSSPGDCQITSPGNSSCHLSRPRSRTQPHRRAMACVDGRERRFIASDRTRISGILGEPFHRTRSLCSPSHLRSSTKARDGLEPRLDATRTGNQLVRSRHTTAVSNPARKV
jgi:hypothetical protein